MYVHVRNNKHSLFSLSFPPNIIVIFREKAASIDGTVWKRCYDLAKSWVKFLRLPNDHKVHRARKIQNE